jgi:chromosome condensin MukBEF MukE localization factor
MTLSEEVRERLADLVELQPTKNSELQERWGLESGSEVHQYLENELNDYYYRDDNSLIRANKDAAELVDVEPGVVDNEGVPEAIRVPELQHQVFSVVAGPDEDSESVVSVLRKLRAEFDADPAAEDVRSALQSLRRKGVVEVIYRTVPTFRLTVERDSVEVSVSE